MDDIMEQIKAIPSDSVNFHLRGKTLGESLSAKVLAAIADVLDQYCITKNPPAV